MQQSSRPPYRFRPLSAEQERGFVKLIGAITERNTPLAESMVADYLADYPEAVEVRLLAANLRFERHDFEAALALLRTLSDESIAQPVQPHVQFQIGLAHMRLGNDAAALRAFRQSNRGSGGCETHHVVGGCLHRLGELAAAIEAYRAALAVAPDQAPVRIWSTMGLVSALRDIGRGDEAERLAQDLRRALAERSRFVGSAIVYRGTQFDFHGWRQFRDKDRMHRAIADFNAASGAAAFPFAPQAFAVPGERPALRRAAAAAADAIWIAKPRNLSGAQGVAISDHVAEIDGRDGYLVQRYIDRPLLVDGRKFHLRLYMFLVGAEPMRAYLWHDGLAKFAPDPYARAPASFADAGRHLTNTERNRENPGSVTAAADAPEDQGIVWSILALNDRLRRDGHDVKRLRGGLRALATGCVDVIRHSGLFARPATAPAGAFGPKLLGLDVIVDDDLRPWLIEMQRAPGMSSDVPLTEKVNARLFRPCAEMAINTAGAPAAAEPVGWRDQFDPL